MIIDNVNILTTLGLEQSWVEGILNLPARKETISLRTNEAKDIVFQEYDVTVYLFGFFASDEEIGTMISDLKDIIQAKQVHDISFPNHGFTCKGVFNDGINVQAYHIAKAVEITMKITVTE